MARQLAGRGVAAGERRTREPGFLAAIAAAGVLLITLYGLNLAGVAALVTVPTALFLAVYLACMPISGRPLTSW